MTTSAARARLRRVPKFCTAGSVWIRDTRVYSFFMCQDCQICYKRRKIILKVSTVPPNFISRSLVVVVKSSVRGMSRRNVVMILEVVVVKEIDDGMVRLRRTKNSGQTRPA